MSAQQPIDDIAERVTARAVWDDLVLADDETATLRSIVDHVRAGGRGADTAPDSGVSVLFIGAAAPETRVAAEVLARELASSLYRVDLATLLSRYIGETEKNLRRLAIAAERSAAVLLLDRADALFAAHDAPGRRHEHATPAGADTLLRAIEARRGLTILATSIKSSLDPAFTRRLRFIVTLVRPAL